MTGPWQTVTSIPSLMNGEVHIWRAFVDWPAQQADQAISYLSSEKQQRAARFVAASDRQRFIASHAVLQDILAHYLGASAKQPLSFHYGQHGKPALADADLPFNMSGSRGLVLYAISRHHQLGVDVEYSERSLSDLDALAKRFFSSREYEQLQAFPAAQRQQGFYRCWTLKEAYIKVIGEGLSLPLSRFSVDLAATGMNALLSDDDPSAPSCVLGGIAGADKFLAALAVKGAPKAIKYYTWEAFLD